MNLIELLDQTARRWPQSAAFIEGETTVFYAALMDQIDTFSARLRALEVAPGCRVGLRAPNSVSYVALTFALWRVNAVVVPIPMECTAEESDTLAEAMQLEAFLSPEAREESVPVSKEWFFTPRQQAAPPDNHGLNIAFIRFTSGTTNTRKGVVLTHETIHERILTANRAFAIGPEDIVMWCLPMSHHFLITIVLYLIQGATVVLARHILARPFLEAINQRQGTVLYAAPFHYALLARESSSVLLPSVRLAVSTTCALPQDVADDFFARFQLPLVQALGIIELGLVSLNTDDPRGRWNSVGRLLEGWQVQIVDPDENGCGEIALAGPGMFDAYAAPWLPRELAAPGGWFHTGDIGWLDADGFLFLAGRKTAVINLAGRKVFPEEIETVINRHPAVRESRVYGRVHPHLGEVVEAEVVLTQPDADPEGIRDFCRAKLASYKIPTRLHIVSALPRTNTTGKIRRAEAVSQHG